MTFIPRTQVRNVLGVKDYMLNEYIRGLEAGGYRFAHSGRGRLYRDEDVLALSCVHRAVQQGEQVMWAGRKVALEIKGVSVSEAHIGKYKAGEVAKQLGVPAYTVNNLVRLLEKSGRTFQKIGKYMRAYSDEDVKVLQDMLQKEKSGIRFREFSMCTDKKVERNEYGEAVYRLREFANQLGEDRESVRGVALSLEREGYKLTKGENGLCKYGYVEYQIFSAVFDLVNRYGYKRVDAVREVLGKVSKRKTA
ncbi:hypothetical protein [Bacillus cereus]|uniref:hypothetical protein n=1 Tax=Bacillus cereus TaxID=1396 RepID=UPI000BFB57C3|nr:hypothetical protein [Bacillus cereus]PGR83609.1 hypothetical protein COC63_06380 [Bacillus cereus]